VDAPSLSKPASDGVPPHAQAPGGVPPHAQAPGGVPPHAQAWIKTLIKADPDFRRVIRMAGPLPWRVREAGFSGLLNAIVGQQISIMAAAAIWNRVCALEGCKEPARFLLLSDEVLRAAGLSRPKVGHARAVAQAFCDGVLCTETLAAMSDEAAVATISSVRGLGPWSAEIYLLFALQRQDVFPAGDLALQAAAADLKGLAARPNARQLRDMAVPWQPNRAMAARLLWHWYRHLSGKPPE
jgi:DNA-3-methyladenine glycosylase II